MADTQGRLKVFLCHANENKPIVKNLYDRLVSAGYDPWLDSEVMLPGMDPDFEIQNALRASDAVIICLSSISIAQEGPFHKQLKLAQEIQQEIPPGMIFLIPLRLDRCEPPSYLRNIHWADYTAPDGFKRLVDALNMRARQVRKASGSANVPAPKPAARISASREGKGAASVKSTTAASTNLTTLHTTIVKMQNAIPADDPFFEFGDIPQIVNEIASQLAAFQKFMKGVEGIHTAKSSQAQKNLYYDVVGAAEDLQKFIGDVRSKSRHSMKDTEDLKILLARLDRTVLALTEKEDPNASKISADVKNHPNAKTQTRARPRKQSAPDVQQPVDVVILTVLEQEYLAVCRQLSNLQTQLGTAAVPNLYAWQTGTVFSKAYKDTYRVVVGMTGGAGNSESAMVTLEAIALDNPRYVFFCGIAGGLVNFEEAAKELAKDPDFKPDIHLGDIVITDVIHGYEYGKLKDGFQLRDDWTYRPDRGLLNKATAYKTNSAWRGRIKLMPPRKHQPNILIGQVASGEKVVDDLTNVFFAEVYRKWSKTKAVDMEGAGIGAAINQARDRGKSVGFLMIRGISDIPRPSAQIPSFKNWEAEGGTQERDKWKSYAAEAAAAVTVGLIAEGLPVPPKEKN